MNQQDKIIYLVRHGEPQLPTAEKCYLGQADVPLTERGLLQAQWLGEFFAQSQKHTALTAVYHSPLQRCARTAEIIATGILPCIAVPDLQEIAMGQWELLPIAQLRQQQPELYQQRGAQMDSFCPPEGECFLQCQQRSVAAFQQLVECQFPGTACVVVAHAGVNRCILSWIQQRSLRKLLSIPQPYACVIPLRIRGAQWSVRPMIECPV